MPTQTSITENTSIRLTTLLIIVAYFFSFAVRLIWIWQFKDNPQFYWNGQIMINTNDGYYFASGVQKALTGLHSDNIMVPSMWSRGLIFVTVLLAKVSPLSLETIILYLPAVFSGLIVIPIILLGRLFGNIWWGLGSALLASVTWSFYNRTMIGYYDSDLLALIVPFFILYFLIRTAKDFDRTSMLYASLLMSIYPFLYVPAKPIAAALGLMYALYMIALYRRENHTYSLLIVLYASLIPLPLTAPYNYIASMVIVLIVYYILNHFEIKTKYLIAVFMLMLIAFLGIGDIGHRILTKIQIYTFTGTAQSGLHFYDVLQTVREAGKIPLSTVANRISGSQFGLLLALIGYALLIFRHRTFLLSLPLVGIGAFSYWGGLRFTVYAVPIAAMSAVYLFVVLGKWSNDKKIQLVFIAAGTVILLYPNIQHVIGYRVPTVLNKSEVADLSKLDKIASPHDYTLTWWDYGYPIWFYSDTHTLIDGGKHQHDNYIISKILQTDSPVLAAKLARLSVEKYAGSIDSYHKYLSSGENPKKIPPEYKFYDRNHRAYHSGSGAVANLLFRKKQSNQKDPDLLMESLQNGLIPIPEKTRDIYLYLPYRMMGIFPTVMVFGNIDLKTGQTLRKPIFYPTGARGERNGQVMLSNGMVFDSRKGVLHIGNREQKIEKLVVTQNVEGNQIKVKEQKYHFDGDLIVVYMKSYSRFIVMDRQTFKSMYVQMFVLRHYDKRYFEPVVTSPYTCIYRVKI